MDAKTYFKDHPSRTECFGTSDNYIFHLESDARNHAKSLDNDVVKRFEKANVKIEADPEPEPVIGATKPQTGAQKPINTKPTPARVKAPPKK